MYSLGYDLVVDDSEFPEVGVGVVKMASAFEDKLDAYRQSLSRVTASAVQEGLVAQNLATFEQQVGMLKGEADRLAKQLDQILVRFVAEMDRADAEIY